MRKIYLLITSILLAGSLFAQDTITGWTFPANSGADSLNANLGLPGNLGYDIRYEGDDTTYNTIYFVDGVTSYAAAATGWDGGNGVKFWSVKFKAENYTNFKVSSAQSSDAANPGPAEFKLQWRLSGGDWADIPEGTVTVGNDWTTGVVSALPVPITGQGSSSIYIRWIMSSDLNTNGGTVDPAGVSAIDDIIITATSTLGVEQVVFAGKAIVSPNPNNGIFKLVTSTPLSRLGVYTVTGKLVHSCEAPASNSTFNLDLPAGLYVVTATSSDNQSTFSTRMIVH